MTRKSLGNMVPLDLPLNLKPNRVHGPFWKTPNASIAPTGDVPGSCAENTACSINGQMAGMPTDTV